MVESKLVELVVAGSNPVGHPMFYFLASDFPNKLENGRILAILILEF